MLFRRITSICVFSLTLAFSLIAQGDRGTITGTVTDSAGAPMPNVVVNITNTATNTLVRVTTTGTGEYNVASLQPGSYRVEIVAPGFKRYVQAGIEAAAGTSVRLDAKLEIGQVTETVEVRAHRSSSRRRTPRSQAPCKTSWWTSCPWWSAAPCAVPSTSSRSSREAHGSGNSPDAGRRPGRRLGRHARRPLGHHQPRRRRRRDRLYHALGGGDHRIHGGYEWLQSRIRAGRRRRDDLRLEVGHQAVSRYRLRFPAQRPSRCPRLLRHPAIRLQAERFRRFRRRPV